MTALKKFCLCMLAAIAVLGCTHDRTPAQTVADARIEYESLNYGRCQNLCDGLLADSAKFNELNVGQLCVLAELYTLLDSAANHNKPTSVADVNDANAARCLGRARQLDADSVDAFISRLPAEAATRLAVLNRVSTYLTIPRDSLVVEDELHSDSI